jgi:hypothetical protein
MRPAILALRSILEIGSTAIPSTANRTPRTCWTRQERLLKKAVTVELRRLSLGPPSGAAGSGFGPSGTQSHAFQNPPLPGSAGGNYLPGLDREKSEGTALAV